MQLVLSEEFTLILDPNGMFNMKYRPMYQNSRGLLLLIEVKFPVEAAPSHQITYLVLYNSFMIRHLLQSKLD